MNNRQRRRKREEKRNNLGRRREAALLLFLFCQENQRDYSQVCHVGFSPDNSTLFYSDEGKLTAPIQNLVIDILHLYETNNPSLTNVLTSELADDKWCHTVKHAIILSVLVVVVVLLLAWLLPGRSGYQAVMWCRWCTWRHRMLFSSPNVSGPEIDIALFASRPSRNDVFFPV